MRSAVPVVARRWLLEEGKVLVHDELCRGVHGTSFRGEVENQGNVAIKYLLDFESSEGERRYMEEVARICQSRTQYIAPLVGFVKDSEYLCIVTRYSAKGALARALQIRQEKGRWPVGFGAAQLACVLYGVASAMHFLHERGVVHGALKPENVLFTKYFEPLVTDFLQARLITKTDASEGNIMNTIFLAPEVLRGGPITEKVDVYAYGMLLYVCLCVNSCTTEGAEMPLVLDNGAKVSEETLTSAITKGQRYLRPDNGITDDYWRLICDCWSGNPNSRPDFSEILRALVDLPRFKESSRNLCVYREYIEKIQTKSSLGYDNISGERKLFEKKSYKKALAELSRLVVLSRSSVHETHRKVSEVRFQCKYCTVCYKLTLNQDTGKWEAYQRGEHTGHEDKKGKPISHHLRNCIDDALSNDLSGVRLIEYVQNATGAKIPASTVYYYLRKDPQQDWTTLWRKIPSLGKRLLDAGLRYEAYHPAGQSEKVLESVVFELPGVKICTTDAFIGLVFVDGCHMNDKLRSTLLVMVTITADHVMIPLIGMVARGETKEAYIKMFTFAKASLPNEFTVMSDQSQALIPAWNEVFGGSKKIKRIPCMFHVCQHLKRDTWTEVRQLLICDHKEAYAAMLDVFAKEHKALYADIAPYLQQMCYMSNNFAGLFEIMADSPVECMNSVLQAERSGEPLGLILAMFTFSKKQMDTQAQRLQATVKYCQACLNTVAHRKSISGLVCRKTKSLYIVSEVFAANVSVHYEVQPVNGVLTCTCEGYNRLGIPCRHMYAVSNQYVDATGMLPEIKPVHLVDTIREALKDMDITVNFTDLKETDIQTPAPKKHPGRPRKRRLHSFREYLAEVREKDFTCRACGKKGHTRRSNLCELRQQTQTAKSQKKRKQSFRERIALIMQERRAKSVELRSNPLCLTPASRDDELKQVADAIDEDKLKAISTLLDGERDVIATFGASNQAPC